MKRIIEQAKQQAVAFEQMLDVKMTALVRPAPRPLEPLEIRNAILREIEAQIIPGPHGTKVFPYTEVTVQVRARSAALDAALDATLDGLDAASRQRIIERHCNVPRSFALRVVRVGSAPEEWPSEQAYRVTFNRAASLPAAPVDTGPVTLVLTLRGAADATTYRLAQGRLDIGRTSEVCDRDGQLVRRNTVVVTDAYDPNGTVSRTHAHIKPIVDAEGRRGFTIYDDGSRYGTRIVRDGETLKVHAGTRGVRLRDGDDVQLGDVCIAVRFDAGMA